MKILVTGKNGFVAKNLAAFLSDKGEDVVTTTRSLESDPHNYAVGDLNRYSNWGEALAGVGAVVHLAARVHVMRETAADPEKEFMEVNYEATKRLADQAEKAGVKKFIFLSTIFVNGESTEGQPFTERNTPNPQNDYARSKLKAEKYLLKTFKNSKMEVIILRPPMIYGPGAKGNWAILVKVCRLPIPLPFKSFDKNKRSFLYVMNLVEAVYQALKVNGVSGVFLVADDESVSTYEFVRLIRTKLKKHERLFCLPFLFEFLGLVGQRKVQQRLGGCLEVDTSKIKETFRNIKFHTIESGVEMSMTHNE